MHATRDPGYIRRRLASELATFAETIAKWEPKDAITHYITSWKEGFASALSINPNIEKVFTCYKNSLIRFCNNHPLEKTLKNHAVVDLAHLWVKNSDHLECPKSAKERMRERQAKAKKKESPDVKNLLNASIFLTNTLFEERREKCVKQKEALKAEFQKKREKDREDVDKLKAATESLRKDREQFLEVEITALETLQKEAYLLVQGEFGSLRDRMESFHELVKTQARLLKHEQKERLASLEQALSFFQKELQEAEARIHNLNKAADEFEAHIERDAHQITALEANSRAMKEATEAALKRTGGFFETLKDFGLSFVGSWLLGGLNIPAVILPKEGGGEANIRLRF